MKTSLSALDRTALTVVALVSLAIVVSYALGSMAPLTVELLAAPGPRGPLVFNASAPVNRADFEAAFSIQPHIPGRWLWDDLQQPRSGRYLPSQPLSAQQVYRVALSAGSLGANGERLRQPIRQDLQVRLPEIIYRSEGRDEQLWVVAQDGSQRQLTRIESKIFDYSPTPDGDTVAISVINERMGVDLWLIQRDGSRQRLWMACGVERCTAPAFSPDGTRMVYSRQSPGLSPDDPLGPPRPWLADMATGQTAPLVSDSQVLGYGPDWSPDGQRIAFFSGIRGGIEVVELANGARQFLTSSGGKVGAWSPDGSVLLYNTVEQGATGPIGRIYQMDFKSGVSSIWLEQPDKSGDPAYDAPVWAPLSGLVAIGERPNPDIPDRQIRLAPLVQPDGGTAIYRPGYALSGYRWDAWGSALTFQAVRLGVPFAPEIWLWSPEGGIMVLAAGSGPLWLP